MIFTSYNESAHCSVHFTLINKQYILQNSHNVMCREGEGAFSYNAATDSFDFDLEEDDEVHLWH